MAFTLKVFGGNDPVIGHDTPQWAIGTLDTASPAVAGTGVQYAAFISHLTGLDPYSTYHVRAYATNGSGTAYGNEVDFQTNVPSGGALLTLPQATIAGIGVTAPINVKDFGALGNGTTDDHEAILAAIAAAAGQVVWFPTGVYYIATTLTVPNGTLFLGDGMALSRIAGTVSYGTGCTFTDITIDTLVPTPVFNVMDYGAHGDGTTDDVAHIQSAITAAAGGQVYFPNHTYLLASALTVPSGTKLAGESMAGVWLKGRINFGSTSSFTDLKIGNAGNCGIKNNGDVTTTTFTRCHFYGGGVNSDEKKRCPIELGYDGDVAHVTFTDCEVARCLGTETATFTNGLNNLAMQESDLAHVSDLTFTGCHFGVSNGVATGSPRMNYESWTHPSATIGFTNLTLTNCVFEIPDAQSVDFSDSVAARTSGVLVEGCTFKGAKPSQYSWGYAICLEWPLTAIIRNNTFYRCTNPVIEMTFRDDPAYTVHAANYSITGNTFDMDTDNGITQTANAVMNLRGDHHTVNGSNVFICHSGKGSMIDLCGTTYATVTGNTFHLGGSATPVVLKAGTNTNYTITPNTVD